MLRSAAVLVGEVESVDDVPAAATLARHVAGDDGALRTFVACQVASCAVAAGLGFAWYRSARRRGRDGEAPTSAHFALAAVVVTEVVALFGAWRLGPVEHWWVSRALYALMFVLVGLTQGRYLCSPQSSPS
jgi:hypothetical protein